MEVRSISEPITVRVSDFFGFFMWIVSDLVFLLISQFSFKTPYLSSLFFDFYFRILFFVCFFRFLDFYLSSLFRFLFQIWFFLDFFIGFLCYDFVLNF